METTCPKCGNIVEGEDPKGNGSCICYWCDECEMEVHPDD